MGIEQKILVRGASLAAGVASTLCALLALTACGQKGNLYMPNDPEFKQRATLPEIVRRQLPGNTPAPATGAASAPTSGTTVSPANQPATTSPATAAPAATGR